MLDQDLRAYESLVGALEVVLRTLRESQSTARQFKWNNEYGEVLRLMQRRTKEIMSFVELYTGMSWAYRQLAKTISTHLEWAEEVRTLLRTSGFSESEIDQAKTLLSLSEIANVHRLLTDR
jgi:hypothetical protein